MRSRRIVRYIWFIISIAAGAALGLFIGWSRPVDSANAPPTSLRTDYQLDVVLMIAEIYHQDGDLAAAQRRLIYLDPDDPVRFVQQAALDAHSIGYSTADLELIVSLSQAFTTTAQGSPGGSP